jgi:hypothetical protein
MMRISLSPQEFRELLLSHHPDHPCFNDDVFIVFSRRVCAGCVLAYPTAVLVLLFLHPEGYESIFLSIVLAIVSQARRVSKNILLQHSCRIIAGIALGFGIGGIYWALSNGQWFAVIVLVSGAALYTLLKAYSVRAKLLRIKKEREQCETDRL